MSKSYRQTPIFTGRKAGPMKCWKQASSQRIRRLNKEALAKGKEAVDRKEVAKCNVLVSPSDCRYYFGNRKEPWIKKLWRK